MKYVGADIYHVANIPMDKYATHKRPMQIIEEISWAVLCWKLTW